MFSQNKKHSNLKKQTLSQKEFGNYEFDSIIADTDPAAPGAPTLPKTEERNLEEIADDSIAMEATSNSTKPKTFMELMKAAQDKARLEKDLQLDAEDKSVD